MATVLPMLSTNARKFEGVLLRSLATVGQEKVASAENVDVSTVSRWASEGKFAQIAQVIDALGLKVVPQSMRCYDEKTLDAMLTLAKQRMQQIEQTSQLSFDE